MNTTKPIQYLVLLIVLFYIVNQSVVAQQKIVADTHEPKISVGLCLSGGGARAFAQIGVIKVLEEAGFDVHYISGSSLGAVIGGLYAMGYSIHEIERLAVSEDWSSLLSDDIQRQYLSAAGKRLEAQVLLELPIKTAGIGVPVGLMNGQQYNQFLSRITIPVSNVYNFNHLYRTFSCRASDLLSGKSVELTQGSLAMAMRASTAVPTIFAPLLYHNMYLVDGGVFNNYPVKDCKRQGADVVIGVNTQSSLYSQHELSNMVNIMMQSVYFNAEWQNALNEADADFNIKPNLSAYGNTDFDKVKSIIADGYEYAKTQLPTLLAWADSMAIDRKKNISKFNQFPKIFDLYVDSIIVKGNKSISKQYIINNLKIKTDKPLSLTDLDKRISYLYGTDFFNAIYYYFEPLKNGKNTIVIEVAESEFFKFGFGAHYNDYSRTAILLRLNRRNIGFSNALLDIALSLGQASKFRTTYEVDNGLIPGFGVEFSAFNQYGYTFNTEGIKENRFNIGVFNLKSYFMVGVSNVLRMRSGFSIEAQLLRPNISFSNFHKVNQAGYNLFAEFEFDDMDSKYFPSTGRHFVGMFEQAAGDSYVVNDLEEFNDLSDTKTYIFTSLEFSYSQALSLAKRLSLQANIYYRYIWHTQSLPLTKSPFFGGANQSYLSYYKPFLAYDYQAILANNPIMLSLDMHYKLYGNHYLSVGSQCLLPAYDFSTSWQQNTKYYNWKLAYTFLSPVGPLSITMAKAYPKNKFTFYLNLGYSF